MVREPECPASRRRQGIDDQEDLGAAKSDLFSFFTRILMGPIPQVDWPQGPELLADPWTMTDPGYCLWLLINFDGIEAAHGGRCLAAGGLRNVIRRPMPTLACDRVFRAFSEAKPDIRVRHRPSMIVGCFGLVTRPYLQRPEPRERLPLLPPE